MTWRKKMVSSNMIAATLILLIIAPVILSGCIDEKNRAPGLQEEYVNASSGNLTTLQGEDNMPEIKITSFSSIYMHDNSNNEDIYLFSWENVPGNDSHGLLSFIKNELRIDGMENAQIINPGKEKPIRVFNNENSVEIMLYNESVCFKTGAGDCQNYDLLVKEENGTHNIYKKIYRNKHDISERYYATYDLSIKNSGSDTIDFKLDGLHLQEGDRIFNATTLEPYVDSSRLEVLQYLQKENKLQDTTLLPDQSLNGTVVFRVDSLYNESFLLKYYTTNVTSSFGKSIEALRTSEYFNYFVALGRFPYLNCRQMDGTGTYDPIFEDNCGTWANWVNRDIFEAFKKSDLERMQKSPLIPTTEMVYALKVVPERNITMSPVTKRFDRSLLLVTDDTGEEIINTSRIKGMSVLNNQTYTFKPDWMLNFPGMNISNASVVQISFKASYIILGTGRLSYSNQDIILDDKLNVIVVRYSPDQIHVG